MHGYEIHKLHEELYFPCTREVVYYHLRKGVVLGLLNAKRILIEQGTFSWGTKAEKIVYTVANK